MRTLWALLRTSILKRRRGVMRTIRILVLAATCAAMYGCGGSSDSGASNAAPEPAVVNQSPGGIWQGSAIVGGQSQKTLALASEDGQYFGLNVNEATGCASVVTGTLSTDGSALSGNIFEAAVTYSTGSSIQTDCAYADGSTWGSGTISGTVTQRSSATISTDVNTANGGSAVSAPSTLTFNSLYDEGASLAKIAGSWITSTGVVNTIAANGSFSSQDQSSECMVSGQYSIPNASYNLYSLSVTFSNCAGIYSVLNGQTATGLVTIDDSVSPRQLDGGVSVKLSTGQIVIALETAAAD